MAFWRFGSGSGNSRLEVNLDQKMDAVGENTVNSNENSTAKRKNSDSSEPPAKLAKREPTENSPGETGRYKEMANTVDEIVSNSNSLFVPGRFATMDEAFSYFRDRVSQKMNVPGLPANYGVKIYVLSDVQTGTLDAFMYAGKNESGENAETSHGRGKYLQPKLESEKGSENEQSYKKALTAADEKKVDAATGDGKPPAETARRGSDSVKLEIESAQTENLQADRAPTLDKKGPMIVEKVNRSIENYNVVQKYSPFDEECRCGNCTGTVEPRSRYCCRSSCLNEKFAPHECFTKSSKFEKWVNEAAAADVRYAKDRRNQVYYLVGTELQVNHSSAVFENGIAVKPKRGKAQVPNPACVVAYLRKRFSDEYDAKHGHSYFQYNKKN